MKDRTIVATAVPVITDRFHALGDVTWYAGGYLIGSCATQLLWGRIYKFYSTKLVALFSIFVFEVGSALCGAAPSSVAFIIGRAIAGVASASMYSGTTVIITQIIPLHKRPIYMAMLGMVFGVSSVAGPLLGRTIQFLTYGPEAQANFFWGAIRGRFHRSCVLAVVLLHQVSRLA